MTTALDPIAGLAKPGVAEPLTYTTQRTGSSAGRECRVIYQGHLSGLFYCAEDGCDYTNTSWSSVFAHRSKHSRDATAVQTGAFSDAMRAQLSDALTEVATLRGRLAGERARRVEAEKQLAKIKRAFA